MRISAWSSDVCSSDLGDDFGGQRHRVARDRHAGGDRRDRRPEQRSRPVVIALVERVDRAELAAEAQLDRVAGRNGLDLGEQAFGFGEFAEVRALQRAIRSAEHTSALQSIMRISYAVFCLKKTTTRRQ